MTKENQAELKRLERSLKLIDREGNRLVREADIAAKKIWRDCQKQAGGLAKERKALEKRRALLVGRLS